ncbi:MAG: transposase [Cephaloticoccus sp.]|nr:transposase [Cephaloticoccus sp.]MCF7759455.1 transposase [Cephaloticoccus sp.]
MRIGRISVPGATYFVTTCSAGRRPIFVTDYTARIASEALTHLATERDVVWIAGTVMPDHIHAVFQLGDRLSLDRVIAKSKGVITRNMHQVGEQITWQENAFEHRLRPSEDAESYAFYIFMNSYTAGLCPLDQSWPWWVCSDSKRFRFLALRRDNGSPQPEWPNESERISTQIVHQTE